jgi:uncharacterized membrane protein YfcA
MIPVVSHPVEFVVFLVLGALLGAVGGLFGVGGGMVAIPVLAVGFHFDQQHAQGTALAMVAPNLLIGLWNYSRRPGFDRRVAFLMGAVGLPFTYVGALIATHVPSAPLRVAFASFLGAMAIWTAQRALKMKPGATPPPARLAWHWSSVVAAAGGTLSGLFSIGGASIAVSSLTMLFGFTQVAAQGATLGLIAPGTLITIGTYAFAHDVVWSVGIPLAIGGVVSVRYGVTLAHRLPDRTLRLLFALFLAGAATALFLKR